MKALHWKIKGSNFDSNHELAAKYYEKFDELIDEVAEILLMLGGTPKDLKTIIENTGSDIGEGYLLISCENQYYTESEMLISICKMFTHLIHLYNNACKDENIPEDVISKLQEHQYYFRLECDYKSKNRLIH